MVPNGRHTVAAHWFEYQTLYSDEARFVIGGGTVGGDAIVCPKTAQRRGVSHGALLVDLGVALHQGVMSLTSEPIHSRRISFELIRPPFAVRGDGPFFMQDFNLVTRRQSREST